MANPTTPEVRINKLGVPVTKHVLVGGKSSTARRIPAPAALSPASVEVYTGDSICALIRERNGIFPTLTKKSLDEMSSETLESLYRLIHDYPAEDVRDFEALFGTKYARYEPLVTVVAGVGLDVKNMSPEGSPTNPIKSIIDACNENGIREMREMPDEFHFSLVKASIIAKQIGLDSPERDMVPHQRVMVVEAIRQNIEKMALAAPAIVAFSEVERGALSGADDFTKDLLSLADFTNARPGNALRIANLITERGDFDPVFIDSVLSLENPALEEGML